jgi:hypothetical protein
VRGSTSDSIRTTSTGGKIPLGLRSETPVRECPIAYLALIAVRTMLPCVCSFRRIVLSCMPALAPYCPVRVSRLQSSCSSYRPVLVTLLVPYSFLSSCVQYRAQPSTRVTKPSTRAANVLELAGWIKV